MVIQTTQALTYGSICIYSWCCASQIYRIIYNLKVPIINVVLLKIATFILGEERKSILLFTLVSCDKNINRAVKLFKKKISISVNIYKFRSQIELQWYAD